MTQIGYLGAENICNVKYTIKSKKCLKLRFYLDATKHSSSDAEDYCDYIRDFNSNNHLDMYFKVRNIQITKLINAFTCN